MSAKNIAHLRPIQKYNQTTEQKATTKYIIVKNVLEKFRSKNKNMIYDSNYKISNDNKIIINVRNIEQLSTRELTSLLEEQGLRNCDFVYTSNTIGHVNGNLKIPLKDFPYEGETNSNDCCYCICGNPIFWIFILTIIIIGTWSMTSSDSKEKFINNYVFFNKNSTPTPIPTKLNNIVDDNQDIYQDIDNINIRDKFKYKQQVDCIGEECQRI
jgi:hypothetical protein